MTERTEPGVLATALRHATFSSRMDGARLFARHVLALLPTGEDRRVLEIGAGAGDVVLLIHEARPSAQLTGIDFAPANVAAAVQRTMGTGIAVVCADYLEWRDGAFDLIVADSVLHLIDAPVAKVAAKLAADLSPGGLVVATVPDTTVLNRLHLVFRKIWRRMPAVADRLALTLAVRLYSGMSREYLTDRLLYLRLQPRLFGVAEQQAFAAAGLVLSQNEMWPSPSLAKLRHRLMVWRGTR